MSGRFDGSTEPGIPDDAPPRATRLLLGAGDGRTTTSVQDIIVRSVVVYDWHYESGQVPPNQRAA